MNKIRSGSQIINCSNGRLIRLRGILITSIVIGFSTGASAENSIASQKEVAAQRFKLERVTSELCSPLLPASLKGSQNNLREYEQLKPELEKAKAHAAMISSQTGEFTKAFKQGISYNTQVLSNYYSALTNREPVSPKLTLQVKDAIEDLRLKATTLKECKIESVMVTVETKDLKGQPVPNCVVWYIDARLLQAPEKFCFATNSTPTTDLVPAGKWTMWCEKDHQLGNKVTYVFGGSDCREARTVNVPAP